MVDDLLNGVSLRHVSVEHAADEINTLVADRVWHPQVPIHDFVNAVKGVFLVDDGVEQNSQCPYVLFFAAIGVSCKDFRGRIV